MSKIITALCLGLLLFTQGHAQESASDAATAQASAEEEAAVTETAGDESEPEQGPKTMSGMSILGNEEAPKSLVIIPWKSSELGEDISLSNTLDDRAQPVDRDVFLRELRFYKIRSGE